MNGCKARSVFLSAVSSGCLLLATGALAQVQSTISCPAGNGYWDTLSVMMMDPTLAASAHMEGFNGNTPDAYMYTTWVQSQNKVYYVKNPQGNPWDINLYDYQPSIPQQGYVYQWVTELDQYNGQNYWNDPTSCRKFNNGSQSSTADYSMRWAARCAAPGGANSSIWNVKPPSQPYNTNYYTYVQKQIQPAQNLDYALLEVKATGTMTLVDSRNSTPPAGASFNATIMPVQYTYTCSQENSDHCASREVFDYAVDTSGTNPVDGKKHSYGWVRWRLYTNTTNPIGSGPANWVQTQITVHDHIVNGVAPINFQCF